MVFRSGLSRHRSPSCFVLYVSRKGGRVLSARMKLPITFIAVLWIFASVHGAETPPELAAAKARYHAALSAGNKSAQDQYLQDLKKLKSAAKGKKSRALAAAIDAEIDALARKPAQAEKLPYGKPVPGKPGYVTSPYEPYKGYIDVQGLSFGTQVICPYSLKPFLVPDLGK